MKKSIKKLPKKKKGNISIRNNRRKEAGKTIKGGDINPLIPGMSNKVTGTNKRSSRNNSKIRVQFLNSRASTTPYSIISVTKGPTTGTFDYMWYNIDNIEEMLSTAMYGLKTDPPLPSEIVYNVIPNDKSDKNKSDEDRLGDNDDTRGNGRDRNPGYGVFNDFDYR
jgi:hypothetical protein